MKLKKDVLKGICIGMALSFAVGVALPVYAATKRQLDAVFNDIKIVVDGYQITPKDGAGKVVEPFIVDGTTYLPVRAVAEAIGKPVTWDSATQTVYLGEVKKGGAVVGFDTLKPYKTDSNGYASIPSEVDESWTIRGEKLNSFANSIAAETRYETKYYVYYDYNLNGDYTNLSAKIGIYDKSASGHIQNISFYGDGNLLKEYKLQVGDVQDVDINVAGVKTLKIQFSPDTGSQGNVMYSAVYDAKFYPIN